MTPGTRTTSSYIWPRRKNGNVDGRIELLIRHVHTVLEKNENKLCARDFLCCKKSMMIPRIWRSLQNILAYSTLASCMLLMDQQLLQPSPVLTGSPSSPSSVADPFWTQMGCHHGSSLVVVLSSRSKLKLVAVEMEGSCAIHPAMGASGGEMLV